MNHALLSEPTAYPGFTHACPMQVRWSDMDALGHVNNATYLTYLEQARLEWISQTKLWDGRTDKIGLIMARVVLDFHLPLVDNDQIVVYTRVARMGNKSFDTEQHIVRHTGGQAALAASGIVTIVVYDYRVQQSTAIPDEWRSILAAHSVPSP